MATPPSDLRAFVSLWFNRLCALFRRAQLNREMDDELRFHIEEQVRHNIVAGMPLGEAARAARRQFGWRERIREEAHDARGQMWIESMWRDLRYAVRTLRKSPGFTVVAVATLALGIGANVALFAFARGLMLRPLAVHEPHRLVHVRSVGGDESFSYASYERFRTQALSLHELALMRRGAERRELQLPGSDPDGTESEWVRAQVVTGNYFSVLGAQAAHGRVFAAEADRMDDPQAVLVLSHGFWQRRFGGDPSVIGRAVQFENVAFTIVGVMPPGFTGFEVGVNPDLWWPLPMFPQVESDARSLERLRDEGWEWALIVGRLAPGATREQAAAELQAVFHRQRVSFASERAKWTEQQRRDYLARTIELVPGGAGYTGLRKSFARPVSILAVVAGLVLLIACANLAGLSLARGAARRREFAVRAALGAGRGRLVRQMVTESLFLALVGGLVGLLLAHWGTAVLGSYLPLRSGALDLSLDWPVFAFALGLSALTGVLFGLLPALRLSEGALLTTKAATGDGRSRLNHALVVAQIALSVTLLAGAGLFARTLQKLRAADLGFRSENVVEFNLEFGRSYSARQRADVHRRLLESLAVLPDVRGATLSGAGLFSGDGFGIRVGPEGYTPAPEEQVRALVVVVGPDFFSTLGIPLRAGREFTPADELAGANSSTESPLPANTPRVVVVGESFARRYYGTTDVIGRTLRFGLNPQPPPLEIVGVAADIKYRTIREAPEMEIYVPYFGGVMNLPMTERVATQSDPRAFAASLRALVQQVDPRVGLGEVRTMESVVSASLIRERVVAQIGGFFAVFALTLASLGLYGVLSYGVTQRTPEIGVRMALGAQVKDVLALVVGRGVKLTVIGTVLGVVAALATTRFVTTLLYGVPPTDPATFLGVSALLLVVATLASWLPARRAAKVDPMVALRSE